MNTLKIEANAFTKKFKYPSYVMYRKVWYKAPCCTNQKKNSS